jgi:hypothetical protein
VSGLKVLDAAKDRLTKRDYVVPFMSVDEEDTETPEWILEIVDKETARLDAVGGEDFDELLEESSLGAPHVKAATDGIPEDRKEQLRKAVERSSQRVAFDTALNVLLIRENLDGTEWAIQQIRETATKAGYLEDDAVADVLNGLVGQLESLLDMRTSQLAAKTWGH